MTSPTRWVRTSEELETLVAELAGCRALAIDTEGDSLHHYTEKVCLIQLAGFDRGSWLVDPLALPDLAPLGVLLADPAIVKVLHGGDNDVMSMRRDFGFTFRTLFDTSIAARLLGDTELGLQALVRNELGIELSKGSQKDDWSKRPLTPKQEAYALADVAYLFELARIFTARLAEADRTAWAREEFAALANLPAAAKKVDANAFRRIKGSAKLSPRKQAVLRELHAWREARAIAADRPPFKIVGPDVLLALADIADPTVADVERALASYPRQRGELDNVLDAIERGLDLPADQLPGRAEQPDHAPLSRQVRAHIEALRAWRDAEAQRAQLDPSVVMSQRLLERIAIAEPRSIAELAAVDGIRAWRVARWGTALLALES